MALSKPADPGWSADFSFESPEPGLLILEGRLDGNSIHAKLVRTDESQFLLKSRGFHWISEVPFNR